MKYTFVYVQTTHYEAIIEAKNLADAIEIAEEKDIGECRMIKSKTELYDKARAVLSSYTTEQLSAKEDGMTIKEWLDKLQGYAEDEELSMDERWDMIGQKLENMDAFPDGLDLKWVDNIQEGINEAFICLKDIKSEICFVKASDITLQSSPVTEAEQEEIKAQEALEWEKGEPECPEDF